MRRLLVAALLAALTVPVVGPLTPAHAGPAGSRPDGRLTSAIVFISDRDTAPDATEANDEVYLYEPGSRRTYRLTDNAVVESFPALSPDGRHLAFLGAGGITVCALQYRAGGWTCGPLRGVVSYPQPSGKFVWLPDSRGLVYSGTDPATGLTEIYRVDLFSLDPPQLLTGETGSEAAVSDQQPTVSPDGRYVVYTHNLDLWRRRIDGTDPVQLTSTPEERDFGAAYSPDGKWIAFHSNRRAVGPAPGFGDFDVYLMRAKPGTDPTTWIDLTAAVTGPGDTPSREKFPSWSPDGRAIAFWQFTSDSGFEDGEIYTVGLGPDHRPTRFRNITANNPSDPTARPVGDILPSWGVARRW